MNSRVSWSVDGIDPTVRERAEAAARRAGMSLNDWLNSTIGEASPPNFREPYAQPQQAFAQEARAVDDIHQRLDSITRQIEQISKPAPRQDATRFSPRRGAAQRAGGGPAVERRHLAAGCAAVADFQPGRRARPSRTSSARPSWSSAPQRRSIAPRRRSARPRSIPRSRKSPRARTSWMRLPPPRRQMPPRSAPPMAQFAPPPAAPFAPPPMAICTAADGRSARRQVRISPRWNGIWSRSRARSRRCSVPITSSNRSPPSAANSPKSATPSPRRCRAGRSNRSRTKSARCRAASTTAARTPPTARRWPMSNARWPKSAKCCAR